VPILAIGSDYLELSASLLCRISYSTDAPHHDSHPRAAHCVAVALLPSASSMNQWPTRTAPHLSWWVVVVGEDVNLTWQ